MVVHVDLKVASEFMLFHSVSTSQPSGSEINIPIHSHISVTAEDSSIRCQSLICGDDEGILSGARHVFTDTKPDHIVSSDKLRNTLTNNRDLHCMIICRRCVESNIRRWDNVREVSVPDCAQGVSTCDELDHVGS